MFTITRVVLSGALAMLLCGWLSAQKAPEAAPLPGQIFSAKKIFISSVPGDNFYDSGALRLYNAFYAAVSGGGRYELVSTPADADLIFEISFLDPIVGVTVTGTASTGASGGSKSDPHLLLVIRDPKSLVSLWWLSAHVEPFYLRKTGEKNFDHSVADLATQLHDLTAKPATTSGGKAALTN